MPQLDKLIFFMENIGFAMSFFFMVFYNQYIFYPRLLKNIFVRKFLLLNFNMMDSIQYIIFIYSRNLNFKNLNLTILFNLFQNYYNNFYKKINYFIKLKLNLIRYFLVLINRKFKYLFSMFYAVYRQYIVEIIKVSVAKYDI